MFDSSKSGKDAVSPFDVGFRVFKVSDSNMEDVFYSPNDVTQTMLPGMVNNVKEGRTGLDLLISTRLEWGLSIDCPIDEETVDGKTVLSADRCWRASGRALRMRSSRSWRCHDGPGYMCALNLG